MEYLNKIFYYADKYINEEMTIAEITKKTLAGQMAFMVEKREPNQESLIIEGAIVELLNDLNNIYYDGKGVLYFISLLYDIFYYIPKVIKGRLKTYYSKPLFIPEEEYKLDRGVNSREVGTYGADMNLIQRERRNSLKDKYNTNKEDKEGRAKTINSLRKHLYSNKFTLKAKKLPNGCVTFHELNNDLSTIFPELITLKKDFFSGTTWIEDLNAEELKKKLKNLLQIEVKIVTE